MKKIRNYQLILGVLFLMFLVGCIEPPEGKTFYDEDEVTIADYFKKEADRFSLWVQILEEGGVDKSLSAYNPYGNNFTVFAPTNDAVNKFIAENKNFDSFDDILDSVLGDGTKLVTAIGKYHVVNKEIETVDFSYGALQDTTATGDYINITFGSSNGADTTSAILVNNESVIIDPDIEQTNGIVHVIDKMLEPSTNSALKWIQDRSDKNLSIFARAIEETGVADLMTLNVAGSLDGERNRFTVWAISDDVFAKHDIYSYEDLLAYKDFSNTANLRRFIAYHITVGDIYLNDIVDWKDSGKDNNGVAINPTQTLETFALLPMNIVSDKVIKINEGGVDLDTMIVDGDTIPINYTSVMYGESNVTTRNGPIHLIDNLLEVESVPLAGKWFSFNNSEPQIQEEWSSNSGNNGYTRTFEDLDVFRNLKFRGLSYFTFGVGKVWTGQSNNSSYLSMYGDFIFEYTTPDKLVPGQYLLNVKVDKNGSRNAKVQFSWDGEPIGTAWSLTQSDGNENRDIPVGIIDVTEFRQYTLKVESIVPGLFKVWNIQLVAQ